MHWTPPSSLSPKQRIGRSFSIGHTSSSPLSFVVVVDWTTVPFFPLRLRPAHGSSAESPSFFQEGDFFFPLDGNEAQIAELRTPFLFPLRRGAEAFAPFPLPARSGFPFFFPPAKADLDAFLSPGIPPSTKPPVPFHRRPGKLEQRVLPFFRSKTNQALSPFFFRPGLPFFSLLLSPREGLPRPPASLLSSCVAPTKERQEAFALFFFPPGNCGFNIDLASSPLFACTPNCPEPVFRSCARRE